MKKVLVVLLVVIVLALAFVATRPNTYHVERSATIAAQPQTVYGLIADFHEWQDWSPWEDLDPAMKKDFGGAESGTGASYHWAGNDKVGEGRMTITAAEPVSDVRIRLEFLKPWESTSETHFALAPEGDGTHVTWTMDGEHNFISKAMCIFMSMDQMIGPDFEKGLDRMKGLAQSRAPMAEPDSVAVPAS